MTNFHIGFFSCVLEAVSWAPSWGREYKAIISGSQLLSPE